MVGTILPIVHGKQRQSKFAPALLFYTIGCLIGAGSLGLVLGVLGAALPWQPWSTGQGFYLLAVIGTISLVYSTHELGFIRVPAPQCRWQVPSSWRSVLPPDVAALFYGIGLGVGVTTRIPASTFYPIVIWALLINNPMLAMFGMSAFGLGRALPLICMACVSKNTEESFSLAEVLACWKPVVHLVNGVFLGFAGSFLLGIGIVRS
jgi:hypothetical protein